MRDNSRILVKLVFWLTVIALINIISCDGSLNYEQDSPVVGTWVFDSYDDNVTVLLRSDQLDENQYGFSFSPSGNFIERKNSGWCGTPPIAYKNFEGHWKKLSDNLYSIDVDYWGGKTSYNIQILSVNTYQLRISYQYSE